MTVTRRVGLVAVGVDNTPTLTTLKGAASGAASVVKWMVDNQVPLGVDVQHKLITDAAGARVTIRDVKDAARQFVKDKQVDVLILYFAAHGVIKSVGDEHVLLTDAAAYNYEAISITATAENARTCGIGHVIIISDACRTPVIAGGALDQVNGSAAVDRGAVVGGPKAPVDVFYATEPTQPAIEVDGVGFFTDVMLKTLGICPVEIRETFGAADDKRLVVPSYRLGRYLESAVPVAASRHTPPFSQSPDIRVLSHEPSFFAYGPQTLLDDAPNDGGVTSLTEPDFGTNDSPLALLALDKIMAFRELAELTTFRVPEVSALMLRAGMSPAIELDADVGFGRRHSFETRTGYIVVGGGVHRVIANGPQQLDLLATPEGTDIRLYPPSKRDAADGHRGSILVFFYGGTVGVLPVMPGYIGVVELKDGRIQSLTFQLSRNEEKYLNLDPVTIEETRHRRAIAKSLASSGKLWRLGSEEANLRAEYFREGKRFDPTLGIYGAYAYATAGNDSGSKSIHRWFAEEYFDRPNGMLGAPVPFDVALLAGMVTRDAAHTAPGIAPFCPMMSLGWSYLESRTSADPLHPAIIEAGKYRLSSEWTTFSAADVAPLINAFEWGEIK